MTGPLIDILLATHQGEPYLEQQLASIEAQTWTHWRVIARDDASTDATPSVLARFARRHAERVVIIDSGGKRLGFVRNFERLLASSDAPLFALCDQDDIWNANKLAQLADLVRSRPPDTPALAFSDLELIDGSNRLLKRSMWEHLDLRVPTLLSARLLPLQNCVTGCASLGNRALRALMLPFPPGVAVHDWWMALCASAMGSVCHTRDALVSYRQHATNALGVGGLSREGDGHGGHDVSGRWVRLLRAGRARLKDFKTYWASGFPIAALTQTRAFLERYRYDLPDEWVQRCEEVLELATASRLRRAALARRLSASRDRAFHVFVGLELAAPRTLRAIAAPGSASNR